MSNQTTGSAEPQANSGLPDFENKYKGLQTAMNKRNEDFAAKETAWAEEKQGYDERLAKLAEYEAREAAAREEAEAQEQYEQLRERFEQEPPTPQNPNETNRIAWSDPYPRKEVQEPSKDAGWPV